MKAKEYNFKYSYLYPLLSLILYFLLALMVINLIEIKTDFLKLGGFSFVLLFLFLVESILHFNAALELKVPALTFLVEFALYLLALFIFSGRYQGLESILTLNNLDLFFFWLFSLFLWYQIAEFCRLFEYFRTDFEKLFDQSSENWNLDEFRRLLDYPLVWPQVTKKITWLNLPLFLLWAILGELNSTFVLLSIFFLVTEVFLLALNYLDKKRLDWQVSGIKEFSTIKKGWHKFLLIFIITALVFAFLLPANYQPLPMNRIMNYFSQQLELTETPQIEVEETQQQGFKAEGVSEEVEKENSIIMEILFLVIQLSLSLIFGFLILSLILFLIKSEIGKIKNLPQFFKAFYGFLIKALNDIFSRVKELNFDLGSSWKKRKEKRAEKKEIKKDKKELKNIDLKGENSSIIIRIYNSLLKLLSLKGIGRDPAATPYEYSSYLEVKYQDLKEEINKLTEIFVESAYSNHSLGENAVKAAKSIWKILKKKI